ncbi:MAG: hypothetical protein P8017_09475, partial [Deltaproteobacteria bacterium]
FRISKTISYFTPPYEGLRRPDCRFTIESQRTQRTVFFLRPGDDGRRKSLRLRRKLFSLAQIVDTKPPGY